MFKELLFKINIFKYEKIFLISIIFILGIFTTSSILYSIDKKINQNNIEIIKTIKSTNQLNKIKNIKENQKLLNFIFDIIIIGYFITLILIGYILLILKKIHKKIYFDELTGLLSRDMLKKKFELLSITNSKIAVLFLDLDNFKDINDTLGHEKGDEVLLYVAEIIKEFVGYKELAGRFGGDEFIIIEPYTNIEDLKKKINNLLLKLNKEIELYKGNEKYKYRISGSIGVALYDIHSNDIQQLIKQADTAMYVRKKESKNGMFFYSNGLENITKKKIKIKNSLEIALEEEKLEIYLQPQVNNENRLIGAETLIRWKMANGKIIYPNEFLTIANETGLIKNIDLFVIKQVSLKIKEWLNKGLNPGVISINLTIKNLERPGFIEELENIIKEIGIPNHYLGLEITEESLMTEKNIKKNIEIIEKLKQKGFTISIDDFGTGYSNISYLKKFNIDKLKIDKIFIQDLPNLKDELILKSIIGLGSALGYSLIAEGVETEEQKNIIFDLGIEIIQGYYFDKPLPVNEFEEKWLKNNKLL